MWKTVEQRMEWMLCMDNDIDAINWYNDMIEIVVNNEYLNDITLRLQEEKYEVQLRFMKNFESLHPKIQEYWKDKWLIN